MSTPVPFEIAEQGPYKVASNGVSVLMADREATVIRRRAMTVTAPQSPAGVLLPQLNQLAGELLAMPEMSADVVATKLQSLLLQCTPPPEQRKEWVKASLNGVNAFYDGTTVVLTTQDLWP